MPKIRLITPDGQKLEFELTIDHARIGRGLDNDIVVPDSSVSTNHGELLLKGDGSVEIHDLGSTNGTIVNGARVESVMLSDGGTFRLGNVEGLIIGDAAAAAPSESGSDEEPGEHVEAAPVSSRNQQPVHYEISTLGGTPCPTQKRRGFGPKAKEKDSGGSALFALAFAGLAACAAAIFLIMKMGA